MRGSGSKFRFRNAGTGFGFLGCLGWLGALDLLGFGFSPTGVFADNM